MGHCYKYSVAQFRTDAVRDERLNLAILIFTQNELEVRTPRSLDKLRAISAAVDLDHVRDSLNDLVELDAFVRDQGFSSVEQRIDQLEAHSPISFSKTGELRAASESEAIRLADQLMARLVEPEPVPYRPARRRATRLLTDVKAAFRAERVLAQKGDDLDSHRIFADYKIAEGLPADLLLKNGSMHVVQTVDATSEDGSARRAVYGVAMSALVFEGARMSFGLERTTANLIYSASSSLENLISPSLDAAEHQGAKLINWQSRNDRVRFIIEMSALAQPLPAKGDRPSLVVNASPQGRLKLN